MSNVIYHERKDRVHPVKEWLDTLLRADKKAAANVFDKIQKLSEHSLYDLLRTEMVKRIVNKEPDFYELRCGRYRVAFHHDRVTGDCTLLWGFKKERRNERQEIERARRLLHEFIEGQKQPND